MPLTPQPSDLPDHKNPLVYLLRPFSKGMLPVELREVTKVVSWPGSAQCVGEGGEGCLLVYLVKVAMLLGVKFRRVVEAIRPGCCQGTHFS